MKFCPKCGSALVPRGGYLICRKCGYTERGKEDLKFKESYDHTRERLKVLAGQRVGPKTAMALCPRCGYDLAEILNARAKLYKCKACGYVYRL